jgi:hypothetical protein
MWDLDQMIPAIILILYIYFMHIMLYIIGTELLHRIQHTLIRYSYKPFCIKHLYTPPKIIYRDTRPVPLFEKHATNDIIKKIITTECDIRRFKKQIQQQISLQTKTRYKKVD